MFLEEHFILNLPSRSAKSAHKWGLGFPIKYLFSPSLKCNYLAVWNMDSYPVHMTSILNLSIFYYFDEFGHLSLLQSFKLAPLNHAGFSSASFSPLLRSSGFPRLLIYRVFSASIIFQWGICTHLQTNKLQSEKKTTVSSLYFYIFRIVCNVFNEVFKSYMYTNFPP